MKIIEYNSAQEALFQRWEQKLKETISLARDGAPFPEVYFQTEPRILFVLKEMNSTPWQANDLRAFLRDRNNRGQTWNNIYRWAIGLQHIYRTKKPLSFDSLPRMSQNKREEIVKSIAAINLKKVAGYASSHMPEIEGHAHHFSKELSEQIKLLDPHIIVCCGVAIHMIQGFEDCAWKEGVDGLRHSFMGKERMIVWSNHPQARKNKKVMYNRVVSGLMQLI